MVGEMSRGALADPEAAADSPVNHPLDQTAIVVGLVTALVAVVFPPTISIQIAIVSECTYAFPQAHRLVVLSLPPMNSAAA